MYLDPKYDGMSALSCLCNGSCIWVDPFKEFLYRKTMKIAKLQDSKALKQTLGIIEAMRCHPSLSWYLCSAAALDTNTLMVLAALLSFLILRAGGMIGWRTLKTCG